MKNKLIFLFIYILFIPRIFAQDFGFGFGFDDEESGNLSSTNNPLSVGINGEITASLLGYIDDFSNGSDYVELGNIFSGKLNFSARTDIAEAFINLNLKASESPISIDEAYVRAYFGSFDISAGLRKLTWGKADSLGPLDVINPLDTSLLYTAMADQTDLMSVKIARPLIHTSYRFAQFSKIEAVFVPNFKGHNIDITGKWADSRMDMLTNPSIPIPIIITEPNTSTLDYAQFGIRYTTTVSSSDIGVQYYYGRLPQPSIDLTFFPFTHVQADLLYNSYHQIGIDYAQVLFDFNMRAELAANITDDLKGDDGSVYNPFIAWSLGFDRDIGWGLNLNLQANQNIRLFHNKLGSNDPLSVMTGDFDIEGGLNLTATRISALLSRKFLQDELELRTVLVWGIEDRDFAIMPALIWTKDSIRIAFSSGFFAGDSNGQMGQFQDNNFLKISLSYKF